MLPLAALFVSVGLGFLCFGLVRTRLAVAATAGMPAMPIDAPPASTAEARPSLVYRALEPAFELGVRAGALLSPAGRVQLLRKRIVLAGEEGNLSVERVLVHKAVAAAAGAMFAALVPTGLPLPLWMLAVGGMASLVPDVRLSRRARDRQDQIARALPNGLDLMALTVEAGLGLEQAMTVVTEHLTGPLAEELMRVIREIELGVSRRDALTGLRSRTSVPELSGFVVSIVQADEMGAPIADVLRVQAVQVRLKRRQRAREQAAKTPVKILFPLVVGVFPAMFVVTIGPGLITITQTLLK